VHQINAGKLRLQRADFSRQRLEPAGLLCIGRWCELEELASASDSDVTGESPAAMASVVKAKRALAE
jgi:hypothetical protein